ncbi:MAG: TauD/TfdA family dioxygenase, partial [Chromatiales bacterium]|nr:TauD/TfdA family dioxygenase [Chromatiales bacterium]
MEKQTHPTLTKIDHPSVWTAEDVLASSAWLRVLTDDENEEIERAVEQVTRSGLALNDVSKNTFALPTLGPRLLEMRRELLHGRGFLQIRGLAHDRLGAHGTGIAFWGLGRHLGDEFASQNAKGHLLGHVRDLGESRANVSQRGPYSRETIPYHVDACDIVGLLCLHPARRGGESSVVSSGHLYNLLLDEDPSYAAALFEPVFRDRRDEIPPGKEPWYAIPVFNYFGELLSCTIEPTYIGS